jgi:NAD+ diphosphatase
VIDRQSHKRNDTGYLQDLLSVQEARFLVLAGHRAVIDSDPERTKASIRWLTAKDLAAMPSQCSPPLFLGIDEKTGTGRFTVQIDTSPASKDAARSSTFRPAVDIRSLASQGIMTDDDLSQIATAKALFHWHNTHVYCTRCAGPMQMADGGWKRKCRTCEAEVFPRLDPVVVVLITDKTNCLLARGAAFPEGLYSTISGFVEPGETVSGAVRRETLEETGIELDEVAFVTSQAWPHPHSIMLGCLAKARTTQITLDPNEIEAARWFPRDEVRRMQDNTHAEGLTAPGREAIASTLLCHWLESTASEC